MSSERGVPSGFKPLSTYASDILYVESSPNHFNAVCQSSVSSPVTSPWYKPKSFNSCW